MNKLNLLKKKHGLKSGLLFAVFLLPFILMTAPNAENRAVSETQEKKVTNEFLKKNFLLISPSASFRELESALKELDSQLLNTSDSLDVKMMSGYASLFLAEKYLQQKNFIKAAENSKKGFYLVDEAAETLNDDFKRRYFRLRLDAFITQNKLRCPVAKSDIEFLTNKQGDYSTLKPMLMLLQANYAQNCLDENSAKKHWEELARSQQLANEIIENAKRNLAPKWQDEELALMFEHP